MKNIKTLFSMLIAAGTLFAGTAMATTYTNFELSSGTHEFVDGDILAALNLHDDPDFGANSYEIGVLLEKYSGESVLVVSGKEDVGKWIESEGAFLEYFFDEYNMLDYNYEKFDFPFIISGDASVASYGIVCISTTPGVEHIQYTIASGVYYTLKGDNSRAFLRENANWTNYGTLSGYSLNYSGIYLLDNSSFTNIGTLKTKLFLYDNTSLINQGTISEEDIVLFDDAIVKNSGKVSSSTISLSGNAFFENESSGEVRADINFSADSAGMAKFQNSGSMLLWRSVTFFLNHLNYSPDFNAVFENYGELDLGYYQKKIGFEVWNFSKLTNDDFENKFSYFNGGICSGDNIDFDSFVNIELGSGSQIRGNVSIGNVIQGECYDEYGGLIGSANFQADSENLTITLTGTENLILITGNLTINNSINLTVKSEFDPNSYKMNYSQQFWGGELIFGDGISAENAFLQTSGEFVEVANDTSFIVYDWTLDLNTGTINVEGTEGKVITSSRYNSGSDGISIWVFDGNLTGHTEKISGDSDSRLYSKYNIRLSTNLTEFYGTVFVLSDKMVLDSSVRTNADLTFDVEGELVVEDRNTFLYSPSIIGSGKVTLDYSGKLFSANLDDFTGTLNIAGEITVPLGDTFGAATINIKDTLILDTYNSLSNKITGAGTLTFQNGVSDRISITDFTIAEKSDLSEFSGTMNVDAYVAVESGVNLGTADINISTALTIDGDNTLKNKISGSGTLLLQKGDFVISQNGGDLSDFSGTLEVAKTATVTFENGVDSGTGTVDLAGTMILVGDQELSNQFSGSGTLTLKDGNFTISPTEGTLDNFSGTINVDGKFFVSESVELSSIKFIVSDEMIVSGDHEFWNCDFRGAGMLTIQNGVFGGSTLAWIRTSTLHVAESATFSSDIIIQNDVEKILFDGTLVLNLSRTSTGTFNFKNADLIISDGAKLDLSGTTSAGTRTLSTATNQVVLENLESGNILTLINGAGTLTIESPKTFLANDGSLSAFAKDYIVVYEVANGQLNVRGITYDLASKVVSAPEGLSQNFATDLVEEGGIIELLNPGFMSADEFKEHIGSNPLLNAIFFSESSSETEKIVRNASPMAYAAMLAVPATSFHNDVEAVTARLNRIREDKFVPEQRFEIFAQAMGSKIENDTDVSSPVFDFDTMGILAGFTSRLSEKTTVGVSVGYETGDIDIHDNGGSIDSTDYRVMLFAGTALGEGFINGGVYAGMTDFDAKRRSAFGTSNGDADGKTLGAFVNIGRTYVLSADDKVYATPHAGIAFAHVMVDSFSESGGKALEIDDFSGDTLRVSVGCEFSWQTDVAGTPVRVGFDVNFAHDFMGDEADIDFSLNGNGYTATAKMLSEDTLTLAPSVSVPVSKSAEIYATYAYDLGTDSSSQRANIGFRMKF